jgi:hypothetical protein
MKIIYELGQYWVGDTGKHYTVFKIGVTHSILDSSYRRDKNGLSVAVARCDYIANRGNK